MKSLKYRRYSMSTSLNVAVAIALTLLCVLASVQLYVNRIVSLNGIDLIQNTVPTVVNALSMLDEIGDMNSNMLEYTLGEMDEVNAFYDNFDEFEKFKEKLPSNKEMKSKMAHISRLIDSAKIAAETNIFSLDASLHKNMREEIASLEKITVSRLDEILPFNKIFLDPKISQTDNINESWSRLIYSNVELVIGSLWRYAYLDANSEEQFLLKQIALEKNINSYFSFNPKFKQRPEGEELIRIAQNLRTYGTQLTELDNIKGFLKTAEKIDEIEHYNLKESELVLDQITHDANESMNESIDSLENILSRTGFINEVSIVMAIFLFFLFLFYARRYFLIPVRVVNKKIDLMRMGERNLKFDVDSRSLEIFMINDNLQNFQEQLKCLEDEQSKLLQEKETANAELETAFSELQKTEEQQRLLADDLKKANAELEQFIHIASHDLKEPLKKISGMTQMLEMVQKDSLKDESREFMALIKDNAKSMTMLIDDLLLLTNINSNTLEMETCDMENLFQVTVADYEESFQEIKSSTIIEPLPTVFGHTRLLKQVVDNLIRNAILHGDKNRLTINVCGEQTGSHTIIEMSNSIPEKVIHKNNLMMPFVRGNTSSPGTGIGLSIVKKVLDAHAGEIEIDENNDSYFTIKLIFKNQPQ